jgi:type IV pilus assembly protein PilB
MSHGQRIGELLRAAGLVSETQLTAALEEQEQSGALIGEILIQQGAISELQLTQILSNQLSVAWVSLAHVDLTDELLTLVPEALAQRHDVLPVHFRIGEEGQKILYVAISDPTHVAAMEAVSRATAMHVRPLIAPRSEIRRQIEIAYRSRA